MPVGTVLVITTRASKGLLRDVAFRMTSEEMDLNLTNTKSLVEAIAIFANGLESTLTTLQNTAAKKPEVVTITVADTPYTASWGQFIKVNAVGGAVTVNLPTAVGFAGQTIDVMKIDADGGIAVTTNPDVGETINGGANNSNSTQWQNNTFISDGTEVLIR
jgi:hypothetical protein